MVSTPEQRRRYRKKHPEIIKEQRRKYLDKQLRKKIKENPNVLEDLKIKLLTQFTRLTRLMYFGKLGNCCQYCKADEDLHIHHIRYRYPIVKEDLLLLCRKCHVEEHKKMTVKKEW